MYKYFQPNKKDIKDKYGDCVIRALCKAFNMSWTDVFDEINPISRTLQIPFNCKPCYNEYITKKGGMYKTISRPKKNSHRPTVYEFCRTHRQGTYILTLAHHIVTVQDGHWFDTWDCGSHCVYSYWEVVPPQYKQVEFEMKKVMKNTNLSPAEILTMLKSKEK